MTPEDVQGVLQFANKETGIPFAVKLTRDFRSQPIRIRIAGLDEPSFFCLKASRSPIGWTVELEFDLFASEVATRLVRVTEERRDEVDQWLRNLQSAGYEVNLSATTAATHPSSSIDTLNFQFKVTRPSPPFPEDRSLDDRDQLARLITVSSELLIDLMHAAWPSASDGNNLPASILEGSKAHVLVTRVERSARNRQACFEIHGKSCHGCGLDPVARYGESARHLLHAHHVEPLATMVQPRLVDPRTDLVPLCPNCHSLAHKRTPPFSVLEIQSLLKSYSND